MASRLLMPTATAVWLLENTILTFEQIARLCDMHLLEVKGIADGEIASSIRGNDPVTSGQIEQAELERAAKDPEYIPAIKPKVVSGASSNESTKRRRYTPLSRRHDRPNAIVWLLRKHPNVNDSQIVRLVGTTRSTIAAVRERTHWNYANLNEADPVGLGLCLQSELNSAIEIADKREQEIKAKQQRQIEASALSEESNSPQQ